MDFPDSTPAWDNLDLDLVVKVLSNTLFSPVFIFFIPVFHFFQGAKLTDPSIVYWSIYFAGITSFWGLKWYSRLYRNQASLLFGPGKLDWGEQIVVVTGGSSGVGELIANTLAVRNVTVVVLDIRPSQSDNDNITYYKCDVSSHEDVERVAARIREEIGDPTILINNAGVVQGKLLMDLKAEDIQQTFGVNTLAHYWTIKAFLPAMIKNNSGHVITVASVLAMYGASRMSDYCASKSALLGLHETLRYELDKHYHAPSVRTTLVLPGHILTPLFSYIRFRDSPIWRFFVPSLQPITVAKAIITALDEQHSRTIYLPFFTHFAVFLRTLPSFLQDFAQWLARADHAMDHFVKVTGRRPDEGDLPTGSNDVVKPKAN